MLVNRFRAGKAQVSDELCVYTLYRTVIHKTLLIFLSK